MDRTPQDFHLIENRLTVAERAGTPENMQIALGRAREVRHVAESKSDHLVASVARELESRVAAEMAQFQAAHAEAIALDVVAPAEVLPGPEAVTELPDDDDPDEDEEDEEDLDE